MPGIKTVVATACVWLLSASAFAAHAPTTMTCTPEGARQADVVLPMHLYNQTRLREQDLELMAELTDAIWRRYHVRVVRADAAAAALRVTVAARSFPQASRQGPIPVASTVFDRGHATPTIYLWLGSAERLMAHRPGDREFSELPIKLQNRLLSRILGVSLAHEIGHYLLDTTSHSARGLLRATITTPQMINPRLPDLGLDDQQIASLCDKLPTLKSDDVPHADDRRH